MVRLVPIQVVMQIQIQRWLFALVSAIEDTLFFSNEYIYVSYFTAFKYCYIIEIF